jgi:hypothetical protein
MSHDPVILVSAAVTMQRLQQAAAYGYTEYIFGRVDASRALALAAKMDVRYGLSMTAQQRWRAKARGQSVMQMFMYPVESSTALDWFILRTPGVLPKDCRENWQPIKPRLEWRGYELRELPLTRVERAKFAARRTMPTASWTWAMTRVTFEGWTKRIRSAINRERKSGGANTEAFRQVVFSLGRVPGFRLCRRQVQTLRRYVQMQRRRLHLPPHEWGGPVWYMQARRCASYPLSVLVARAAKGEVSWFPPQARGASSGIMTETGYRDSETHDQDHDHDHQTAADRAADAAAQCAG